VAITQNLPAQFTSVKSSLSFEGCSFFWLGDTDGNYSTGLTEEADHYLKRRVNRVSQ
jgi:hypothetical protein